MKTLITLLSLILCANAFGRPGDTPEQLKARYGEPIERDILHASRFKYQFEAITVYAFLIDGHCVREVMVGRWFDEGTVLDILKSISDGKAWSLPVTKKVNREWLKDPTEGEVKTRRFGKWVAIYDGDALVLQVDGAEELLNPKKPQANEGPKLKGF